MSYNRNSLPLVSENTGLIKYLQTINKIPSLTKEEEYLLAKAYFDQNDLSAAQKLVTSHLKLVAKIAMGYKNYGLPITELVSEGNLGLMQAIKKFNPELGFRVSTYAMWWIKAAIQEYILKSWSLVKIGTTAAQKKLFFSLAKIKNKITNLYSRMVTANDFPQIARELGVSTSDVVEMNMRMSGQDVSLNSSTNDESQTELIEFIPETRATQEMLLIREQDSKTKHAALKMAMKILNEREFEILRMRKLVESPATLDDLSIRYNISKERVRQIESKAFKKIQEFMLNAIQNSYVVCKQSVVTK